MHESAIIGRLRQLLKPSYIAEDDARGGREKRRAQRLVAKGIARGSRSGR